MKDYSMNLEERKDFILGYDVTEDGQIIVKFAKGEPFVLPYNTENEKNLLARMEGQLKNSSQIEEKLKNKRLKNTTISGILTGMALISVIRILGGETTQLMMILFSLSTVGGLIPGVSAIRNGIKLSDLRKNIEFLKIKEKLNGNVRSKNNILNNVSNKTKSIINESSKDREIFNINSFNYVPFKDLEQIVENVDRNERFGFNYDKREKPSKGIVKKKVR